MKIKVKLILISSLVCLGAFLRVYNLNQSPPSLNWDEASLGYSAYSISETGKDEYGIKYPVYLRSFDDYKSAIPSYLMIPAIKLFGLNEFGVRIVPAMFSVLSIFLIFMLASKTFKSDVVGLLSAFVFAIEPWSVHYSRTYQEATVSNFFLLLGLVLYTYSAKHAKLLTFSLVSFFLSLLSYHSNKFIVPIVITLVCWQEFKHNKSASKNYLINAIVLVFFLAIILNEVLSGHFLPRVQSTSILKVWSNFDLVNNLNEHLLSNVGQFLFHNKYIYFSKEIVGRFMAYFSPANLFFREPLEPTSKIPGLAVFYPFEFVFWILGLYKLLKNYKKFKPTPFLIVIAVLPAALTWNWFQPNRAMFLFSIYSVLIGLGIYSFIEITRPQVVKILAGLFLVFYCLLNAFFLMDAIVVQIPIQNNGPWQPGFRETVPSVMEISKKYQHVIVETPHAQPYIFYLFYGKYDPSQYHRDILVTNPGMPRKVYDFGKIEFRNVDWEKDRDLENTLLVTSDSKLPNIDDLEKEGYFIFQPKDKNGVVISTLVGTR